MFSTFLDWVVRQETHIRHLTVLHYFDKLLFVASKGSRPCSVRLQTMERVGISFGVPMALNKMEGPTTVIMFWGIVIDTEHMQCGFPGDKLCKARCTGWCKLGKLDCRVSSWCVHWLTDWL